METDLKNDIAALHPVLQRLSRRFTSDVEDASDLVQDTILKALRYEDKFRESTNLQGWLFTIMRNTFINHYRKGRKAKVIHDRTPQLLLLNMQDPHTFSSPEKKYEWADLWKSIDALKDELVIPFKLHTSGYKYREIAEQLRLPVGTVRNRIFNARKQIQKRLV